MPSPIRFLTTVMAVVAVAVVALSVATPYSPTDGWEGPLRYRNGADPPMGVAAAGPPAAPTIDTVEPGGAKQLRLLWTLLDDGDHNIQRFELQRSTDNGATWADAGNVPPVPDRTTTWYDSGLAAGTAYVYRVRAVTADGEYVGAWSTPSAAATALAAADEIPARPGAAHGVAGIGQCPGSVECAIRNRRRRHRPL